MLNMSPYSQYLFLSLKDATGFIHMIRKYETTDFVPQAVQTHKISCFNNEEVQREQALEIITTTS